MVKHKKVFISGCALLAGLLAAPASAQLVIRNGDVSVKFGVLGQFWGDWTQDSTAGPQGYQQNLYLRRAGSSWVEISARTSVSSSKRTIPKLGINPKIAKLRVHAAGCLHGVENPTID